MKPNGARLRPYDSLRELGECKRRVARRARQVLRVRHRIGERFGNVRAIVGTADGDDDERALPACVGVLALDAWIE